MFGTQRRQSDDDKVPVAIDLGKNNDAVLLALAVVAAYSTYGGRHHRCGTFSAVRVLLPHRSYDF